MTQNMSEFFQWKRHPFTDTRPFKGGYLTTFDQQQIQTAQSLLSIGKSFAMAGPSGSGKTTWVRHLIQQLDPSTYHPVYLHYGGFKRSGLLRALADLMGVDPSGRQIPLLTKLQKHIVQRTQQHQGHFPVLIIDDAHLLEREALLDLCSLLVSPETNRPVCTLILVGDAMFPKQLRLQVMAPVKTRLTTCFPMNPLDSAEISALVRFRLNQASAPETLFETEALDLIATQVSGNRRELMNLCILLLEEAFRRNEKTVGAQLVHSYSWDQLAE